MLCVVGHCPLSIPGAWLPLPCASVGQAAGRHKGVVYPQATQWGVMGAPWEVMGAQWEAMGSHREAMGRQWTPPGGNSMGV